MVSKLLKYIKYGSIYGAIEHQRSEKGEKLALLLLKKNENEFLIEIQKQFSSFITMSNSIKKKQHLHLIVNNNNVVSKSITKELNEIKAVLTAFPTIKINDFFYEVLQLEAITYISICRKEYIIKLIHSYEKQQINIIGFSLGNSIINNIIPFIENQPFTTSNADIKTKNNRLVSIDLKNNTDETHYNINGIHISNNYILPLAGIVKYYSKEKFSTSNFDKINLLNSKRYAQKRFFKLGLNFGLISLFILLFLNFILFEFYNDKINYLNKKKQINLSSKKEAFTLTKELEVKKKLIANIISSTSSKSSLYFDQIGELIPKTIVLTSMYFQPILKSIEVSNKVELDKKVIILKGTSVNGKDFSNWVDILQNRSWIKNIVIMNYSTKKKLNTLFELKIILK